MNATRMVACLNVFVEFVALVWFTLTAVVMLHDSQWLQVARALALWLHRGHRCVRFAPDAAQGIRKDLRLCRLLGICQHRT